MKSLLKTLVTPTPNPTPLQRRTHHAFALLIHSLILLSLITFTLATLPDLTPRTQTLLTTIETICIAIFTAEYLLRIYTAPHRRKFIFSFWGIIDLLAIAPYYLALGLDLRPLRAFRFFQLLRLFKLVRYHRALTHLAAALALAREKLLLFLLLILILLYLSAIGIYHFEHPAQPQHFSSLFTSLWWAVITLTTVGYGDIYPITAGGRIFTFFILIIGIGIIAIPTGIISSALTQALDQKPRPTKPKSKSKPKPKLKSKPKPK